MLNLTAIKARHNEHKRRITKYSVGYVLLADIDSLIAEVERLAVGNKQLSRQRAKIGMILREYDREYELQLDESED